MFLAQTMREVPRTGAAALGRFLSHGGVLSVGKNAVVFLRNAAAKAGTEGT